MAEVDPLLRASQVCNPGVTPHLQFRVFQALRWLAEFSSCGGRTEGPQYLGKCWFGDFF